MNLLLTEEELSEFLAKIGIRPEGIQAILKTFITKYHRGRLKELIESMMKRGRPAKEATGIAWYGLWKANFCHKGKIGETPTKEDFLKL